jgi:16S rRNA processing protein RimM
MSEGEFATIARIRRPQGRRGEVAVELYTDFPERFEAGTRVWLSKVGPAAGERREMELEDAWPHKGSLILKFAGVESISDAETLSGWEIQVPKEERIALEGSAVYLSDLIGCKIVERGVELGTIADVDDRVGTPVLMVSTPQGELLIPFAQEICRVVDTERRVVEVELPEGLRELNEVRSKDVQDEHHADRAKLNGKSSGPESVQSV